MSDERQNKPSASGFERLQLCPGSWDAEAPFRGVALPAEPENEDAAAGNRIHAWIASTLSGDKPSDLVPEEYAVADRCVSIAYALLNQLGFTGYKQFVEKRLWSGKEWSGKSDAVFVDHERCRALVIDFKSGRGKVKVATQNHQLRALAVLVAMNYVVSNVVVAIIQPFADSETVNFCEYGEGYLIMAREGVESIVKRALTPGAERIAGPAQCKSCRAKTSCEEYNAWCIGGLPVPVGEPAWQAVAWSPEVWSEFLKWEGSARKWLDDKKSEAMAILKANPGAIPGFTLKSNTRRTVTNALQVFRRASSYGVSGDVFSAECKITLGAIRKLIGTVYKKQEMPLEEMVKWCVEGSVKETTFETLEET